MFTKNPGDIQISNFHEIQDALRSPVFPGRGKRGAQVRLYLRIPRMCILLDFFFSHLCHYKNLQLFARHSGLFLCYSQVVLHFMYCLRDINKESQAIHFRLCKDIDMLQH